MDVSEFDALYQKTKEKFLSLVKRGAVDPKMASDEGYIFQMYCQELVERFSKGEKHPAAGTAEKDKDDEPVRMPKGFFINTTK